MQKDRGLTTEIEDTKIHWTFAPMLGSYERAAISCPSTTAIPPFIIFLIGMIPSCNKPLFLLALHTRFDLVTLNANGDAIKELRIQMPFCSKNFSTAASHVVLPTPARQLVPGAVFVNYFSSFKARWLIFVH